MTSFVASMKCGEPRRPGLREPLERSAHICSQPRDDIALDL
jgi:hypothetical protein